MVAGDEHGLVAKTSNENGQELGHRGSRLNVKVHGQGQSLVAFGLSQPDRESSYLLRSSFTGRAQGLVRRTPHTRVSDWRI